MFAIFYKYLVKFKLLKIQNVKIQQISHHSIRRVPRNTEMDIEFDTFCHILFAFEGQIHIPNVNTPVF